MVVPAVGPIVVVSRTVPEVVTPIVIVVTWAIPERSVVVVVVPTVVVDVVDVDIGIAVVPIGAVVVVSPIPGAPVVVAVAPVVVAVAPVVVAVAPVVVAVTPVVVAVPIRTVPTASTAGSIAIVDNPWKRLNTAAGPIATTDARSVGLGLRPILPANIGTVWATDRPVAVDVWPVATLVVAVADVTPETRSGFGRQLAVTP